MEMNIDKINTNKSNNSNQVDRKILQSALKLFKVVPDNAFVRETDMATLVDQFMAGFVVCTEGGILVEDVPRWLFNIIKIYYGNDAIDLNQTFFSSFGQVANLTVEERIAYQIRHYFSTYGCEALGYKSVPYLPFTKMDFSESEKLAFNNKKLTIIKIADSMMIHQLTTDYAITVTKPKIPDIADFKNLVSFCDAKIDDIKSFELQAIVCDYRHKLPTKPTSILRYLIFKATDETLLIKNHDLITKIKCNVTNRREICQLFVDFDEKTLNSLASIFYRYKPLFLAFKSYHKEVASIINKIRRKAVKYHAPLSNICLQNWLSLYKNGNHEGECEEILDKASNMELVKLANACANEIMLISPNKINNRVFNIRNNKAYVKADDRVHSTNLTYKLIDGLDDITEKLYSRFDEIYNADSDIAFIIPEYIDYALPTSEKQFICNFPWGTKITTPSDRSYTTGIHWSDYEVDLDLHLMGANGRHYGWNGSFKDAENNIIFSGDMTRAPKPHGAAEAYYFNPNGKDYCLSVSNYCGHSNVNFQMFMTSQPVIASNNKELFSETYKPEDAFFTPIPLQTIGNEGFNLGLFFDGSFRFYGATMTQYQVPGKKFPDYIKGMKSKIESMWLLKEFLQTFPVRIFNSAKEIAALEPENTPKRIIDLSPESLSRTTLVDLINGEL